MAVGSRSVQQDSGAMTRISGGSSWNKDLENTWDWTAVNALVKFTTVNVNAVHINRKDNNNRKDQGVASRKHSG